MRPSFTTTAPTMGLGEVCPLARPANLRASAINSLSAGRCTVRSLDNKNTPVTVPPGRDYLHATSRHRSEIVAFFHPDCTVGSGIAPDHAVTRRVGLTDHRLTTGR